MRRLVMWTCCWLTLSTLVPAAGADLLVDADFPGGNIVVDRIEGDHLYVHQDLRDTSGNWFYWHFRVKGAAGRALTVHFTTTNPLGVLGPAVSVDGGRSWSWLGAEAIADQQFRCQVPDDADVIHFCVAMPYQQADLERLLARHVNSPHLVVEELCRSRQGRTVELLRLGQLQGQPTHRVALTCRHHACESTASYAVEGLIEAVLADTADGQWLREHVEFFIVPFVDKDGVEDGDQGKNRIPHDHNRDYVGESLYPEIRAIREALPAWADGKLRIALDLHCPGLRGREAETLFFVGGPDEAASRELELFSQQLQQRQTGPLRFDPRHNLAWNTSWNSAARMGDRKPFSHWAAELPGDKVATTIEIAYARAGGQVVNAESARALGKDLAVAMRHYLLSLESR